MNIKTIPRLLPLLEKARELELTGHYRQAFNSLSPIWTDFNNPPDIDISDIGVKAELYLRCGSLAGLVGRVESGPKYQERAKDLLMTARDLFIQCDDICGIVAAENALAFTYLRANEPAEAEIWIENSFSRDLDPDRFERLESFIANSMILRYAGPQEVIGFLTNLEPYFKKFDDNYLNGCFSTNLGIAYRNAGRNQEAIHLYSLARHYHHLSGHEVYLATVENNLAGLYKDEGLFDLGLEYAYRALAINKETGDLSRFGYTLDTIADIYLSKGELNSALECVNEGIEALIPTGIDGFLIDTYITKIKIQIAMDSIADAIVTFVDLVPYVRASIGENRVSELASDFERRINKRGHPKLGRILTERIIPGEQLELELPAELSEFESFEAIWVKNSFLTSFGLQKGDLAIVVDEDVKNGDLAAVVEIGEEDVVLGRLEKRGAEYLLFSDADSPVKLAAASSDVLGRVIGFAGPQKNSAGKLTVRILESI